VSGSSASPEARLVELGITLPDAPAPVATYSPFVVTNGTVYISGQVPIRDGGLPRIGLVGSDVTQEEAVEEARACAINVLAQLRAAAGGSLDNVERLIKVTVFVARPDSARTRSSGTVRRICSSRSSAKRAARRAARSAWRSCRWVRRSRSRRSHTCVDRSGARDVRLCSGRSFLT